MSANCPRILIVEDEAIVAAKLRQNLVEAGYDVTGMAMTGEEAIQQAAADQPDLVLMDIKLCGPMDGIEAATHIRARADIPIIYLTAHADAEVVDRAKSTSPSGYLVKPVQPSQLQAAMTMALHQYALERELRETNQHLTQAETHIRHLNAVLGAIRNVNQLITREADPDRLLQAACQNLVATRGFSYAKVIMLDASARPIKAFESGIGEQFIPFLTLLESGYLPYCLRQALTHTDILIIENSLAVCGDCPLAPLFSDQHKLTVRMQHADRVYGLLTVSLPKAFEISVEEQALFQEVAGDLAFALHNIEVERERQQAAEALRDSRNMLRTVLDAIPSAVFWKDRDLNYLGGNRTCLDAVGLKCSEEIVGKSDYDLPWEQKQADSFREYDLMILKSGVPEYGIIEPYRRADDAHAWARTNKVPLRDAEGNVIGVLGTYEDITDRRQAEDALRASEERYRRITAAVTDYIYTVRVQDGQPIETVHGPACVAVTGYTSEEFRAHPYLWFEMVYPEDRPAIQAYAASILAGNKADPFEHRILRKDGALRWVCNTAVPHYDAHGQLVSYDGLVRDITDRKEAEVELEQYRAHLEELVAERMAELQQANRQLAREIENRTRIEKELQAAKEAAEKANQEKSAFLASMSHDIRTPLNAILGFSQILKEQLRDMPQYQHYLDRIATGGDNLLRLINDVLDLSKIEAGRIESRAQPLTLRAILTEMEHLFALKAKEKGIQFQTEMEAAVPAAVQLDGAHLRQILINLIGNAVKFTEQGSVTLEILDFGFEIVDLKEQERSKICNLKFKIQDTGVGIAPEDLNRIFEPFYQATQRFGGTGLGLAISKRLTELMHGALRVTSQIDVGTTFTLEFPDVPVVNMESPRSPVRKERTETFRFAPATILIVEDHASNREIIRNYLTNQPFQILEAENGQAALDLLNEQHPALILMDIQMPVMGGDEAARRIRREEEQKGRRAEEQKEKEQKAEDPQSKISNLKSKIPIIALTAYALKEQREQLQDVFDGYLIKPIDKPVLLTAMGRFLPHETISEPVVPRETAEALGQQDVVSALRASLPVPQALRDRFQDDLLPQYQACNEIMSIDELLAFAETITAVGREFQIVPLAQYGEQLTLNLKIFQIQEVKRLLAVFPQMLAILCA